MQGEINKSESVSHMGPVGSWKEDEDKEIGGKFIHSFNQQSFSKPFPKVIRHQ